MIRSNALWVLMSEALIRQVEGQQLRFNSSKHRDPIDEAAMKSAIEHLNETTRLANMATRVANSGEDGDSTEFDIACQELGKKDRVFRGTPDYFWGEMENLRVWLTTRKTKTTH